jgi:hypothetical protein
VQEEVKSLCQPDGMVAEVGLIGDSVLVLDMGVGNEIVDGEGGDFHLYEFMNGPGILIDKMELAVAQDDGTGKPGPFTVIYVWGDDDPDNNGAIPAKYLPEEANKPIDKSDLYNGTGIGINIGSNDGKAYRFVRVRTYPTEATPNEGKRVQLDAIQKASFEMNPTPTPTVEQPSPTVPPTVTNTVTVVPTPTSTPLSTDVPTATPMSTATPMPSTSTPEPQPTQPSLPPNIPTREPSPTPTPLEATATLEPSTATPSPEPSLTSEENNHTEGEDNEGDKAEKN